MNKVLSEERLRRWRLVLGSSAASTGAAGAAEDDQLTSRDLGMDRALAVVYDAAPAVGQHRNAGLGASAPAVTRWLGDIRKYFPAPLVRVLQQDALERLGLRPVLAGPEALEAIGPDIPLLRTLPSLRRALPGKKPPTPR